MGNARTVAIKLLSNRECPPFVIDKRHLLVDRFQGADKHHSAAQNVAGIDCILRPD
jgi:hypothetical protein